MKPIKGLTRERKRNSTRKKQPQHGRNLLTADLDSLAPIGLAAQRRRRKRKKK